MVRRDDPRRRDGVGDRAPGQPRRRPLAAGGARRAGRPDPAARTASSRSTPAAPTRARRAAARRASATARCSTRRPRSSYGAAVARRPRRPSPRRPADDDWVWLLHDDSAPAPRRARAAARRRGSTPSADVLGPKLREWPSLRRLLEVGVTISGTGRRETGLERGEYDQGQHDRLRDVLAVNTAGMLVRRSRARAARLRRAAAAVRQRPRLRLARGPRRPPHRRRSRTRSSSTSRPRTAASAAPGQAGRLPPRRAAGGALHAAGQRLAPAALPFLVVRLLLGSLVRALGLAAGPRPGRGARRAGRAWSRPTLRPWRIVAGRPPASAHRDASPRARCGTCWRPPWLPYRHGLDFVSDLATAVVAPGRRRHRRPAGPRAPRPPRPDRSPTEAQNLPEDTGLLARLLTSPVAWVFAVPRRRRRWSPPAGWSAPASLSGGALLPAPGSALRLVATATSRPARRRHRLGGARRAVRPAARGRRHRAARQGLAGRRPALPARGAAGRVRRLPLPAAGHRRRVPMSLWGARGVRRAAGRHRRGPGGPARHGRRRRWCCPGWRTPRCSSRPAHDAGPAPARRLAHLAVARAARRVRARSPGCSPLVRGRASRWPPALPRTARPGPAPPVRGHPAGGHAGAAAARGPSRPGRHQGAASWLFEAGLPAPRLTDPLTGWDALARPPRRRGPGLAGASACVLAALVALARPDTRAGGAARLGRCSSSPWARPRSWPSGTCVDRDLADASSRLWLGFPLRGRAGARRSPPRRSPAPASGARLAGASFGWRQPVGVLVVVARGALAPVVARWSGGCWPGSDGPLDRGPATDVPTYMTDAAAADPDHGILVVRGSRGTGFTYVLLRAARRPRSATTRVLPVGRGPGAADPPGRGPRDRARAGRRRGAGRARRRLRLRPGARRRRASSATSTASAG